VGYVQDVRYFAIEHMDVRREAFQVSTVYQASRFTNVAHILLAGSQSLFWKVSEAVAQPVLPVVVKN